MLTTILRTLIMYIFITAGMRLMGKRQIGELQPGELVTTILLSEMAVIPIQDNEIPLINSLVALMILMGVEILNSYICMKSVRFRFITEGHPMTVIKNGEIDQKQLKKLRFSINDILAALRQKDIFDINDVAYAVIETNGTLSVMLKPEADTPKSGELGIAPEEAHLPYAVIIDGKFIDENLRECGIEKNEVNDELRRSKLGIGEIILMNADESRNYSLIRKEKKK